MKSIAFNLLLATAAVFLPIKAALVAIVVLTVLDLVSGIAAAIKRKESITSSGLKRTVIKLLVYLSVACLAYVVETFLTGGFVPLAKIASGLVGITELKSILENMEEVTGIPMLQLLIDKLAQQGGDSGGQPPTA
jgi:phage-related holin